MTDRPRRARAATHGTHAELVAATGGDAFIRHDLSDPLEGPGWSLGSALIVPRRTHTRRLGLVVLGRPDDVAGLALELVGRGDTENPLADPRFLHATVERPAFEAFASVVPLTDPGGDWEWMCTRTAPPPVPGEDRVVGLDETDEDEIQALLALANPRTDARPFETPGQRWVGVRDDCGALVACGVLDRTLSGAPILEGITVRMDLRGTGLGLAVTAALTREAVRSDGFCTLGLYSDNDVARRVYHGLGYGDDHLWSSRRLLRADPTRR
ncbi:GNAT family N-acetyltransferase [Intrasporangium calvum]|uniref:Acetyltransferase (GNAT) family protein n=1 Tax=Intrasporangium calvum (strain ATCC 23552 / DSM 43043 / JCM 3097 / NBRC 12989 / NCIMB 10167 / NRRL B-3866 / 7 KIP) TaxID=710696 RepID=E6S8V5_INTC7|nr:GNAT family N-acetyltransferase [Intrasporangium calvum]ADU48092.1 acetyltransferase (GNAT) family protein [Intrasporangium calvum DSM 43043]